VEAALDRECCAPCERVAKPSNPAWRAAQNLTNSGVNSSDGDLSVVRRGEPRAVPALRPLRHATDNGCATPSPQDGHDRLLGPERLDQARRGTRLGIAQRVD